MGNLFSADRRIHSYLEKIYNLESKDELEWN